MNSDTVDIVLQELMERGIKTKGGEQIGKTILQVKAQERMVKRIADDSEYLDGASLEELERIRVTLRGLIRFIADSNTRRTIITDLKDPIIARVEGQDFDITEHYEDCKQKVNRYINEHSDDDDIRKLPYNEPLFGEDFSNLENTLIYELGSEEEYQNAFDDVPFGLLVRRIVKLDHQDTMDAFGEFINNHSLSPSQNATLNRIISYVEQNGYIQFEQLTQPPFDGLKSLILVFGKGLKDLKVGIDRLNHNALVPTA